MLELDGKDLRRDLIEDRKALLARLLKGSHSSVVLNQVYEDDGEIVFREAACRLGCEGIVSKRLGSTYRRSAKKMAFQNRKIVVNSLPQKSEYGSIR